MGVIVELFGRIFYCNVVNFGFFLFVGDMSGFRDGEVVEVNWWIGEVRIENGVFYFKLFDGFLFRIVEEGGILSFIVRRGDLCIE